MYKEEKIIDGVLCWRGDPEGEFKPYTVKELTAMLLEQRKRVRTAQAALAGCA